MTFCPPRVLLHAPVGEVSMTAVRILSCPVGRDRFSLRSPPSTFSFLDLSSSKPFALTRSQASLMRSREPVVDSCLSPRSDARCSEFFLHCSTHSMPVSMNRQRENPSSIILRKNSGSYPSCSMQSRWNIWTNPGIPFSAQPAG